LSEKALSLPPFYVMEVLERAQELERAGRSIVHLEVGEPDFPTPAHICDAAGKAMCSGDTKYTHSLGLQSLREAIVDRYNRKFGLDLGPDQVIVDVHQQQELHRSSSGTPAVCRCRRSRHSAGVGGSPGVDLPQPRSSSRQWGHPVPATAVRKHEEARRCDAW
jgi:hypothetical protein